MSREPPRKTPPPRSPGVDPDKVPAFARTELINIQHLKQEAAAQAQLADELEGDASGDDAGAPKPGTIQSFDKTGIYQKIIAAESPQELADLENRIELIDVIQRAPILGNLPETALYFLEKELSFKRVASRESIHTFDTSVGEVRNLYYMVEGQALALAEVGEEGAVRTQAVNILKKGDLFFDKPFKWAGLQVHQIDSITPCEILTIPFGTFTKIAKASESVRRTLKAVTIRVDKRAEKYTGDVGKIYNFLSKNGYSYADRVKVIRVDKCIECDACYKGCEERFGRARIWKSSLQFGLLQFPDACRTCEHQHCIGRCAGDHIIFDEDYREVIIKDTCTGCTHCAIDCPYDVIKMVELTPGELRAQVNALAIDGLGQPEGPKSDKPKQLAIKCDHCIGYEDMACITPCPTGAIFDVSQRELYDRLELYGTIKGRDLPQEHIRPVIFEERKFGRALFHTLLWGFCIAVALGLGWEMYSRLKSPALSFTALWMRLTAKTPAAAEAVVVLAQDIAPLRSGDGAGHDLGWVASGLLLLTLVYTVRKNISSLGNRSIPLVSATARALDDRVGSRAAYLDLHIFGGLLGGIFAAYHTAFDINLQGFIQWAMWSLVLVITTGIIGRYFYAKVPRSISGKELELTELESEGLDLKQRVLKILGDPELYERHTRGLGIPESVRKAGVMRLIIAMVAADFRRKFKLFRLRQILRKEGKMSRSAAKEAINLLRKMEAVKQNIIFLEKSKQISRVWHIVHILAAILMFVVIPFHIYLGMKYGIVLVE